MLLSPKRRLLAAALTTALVLGVGSVALSTRVEAAAAASAAQVTAVTPQVSRPATRTTVFNDPWSTRTSAQNRITDLQIGLINSAPRGAAVTLATYSISDSRVVNALVKAHRRGVKVRVLVDDHGTYQATKALRAKLGTKQSARSFVVSCRYACASDHTYPTADGKGVTRPYQHSKFLAVSKAGSSTYVTVIPSGNLTAAAVNAQANDALVTRNDKLLYDFLLGRFDALRVDPNNPAATHDAVTSGPTSLTQYPMVLPAGEKVGRSHDPYYQQFGELDCSAGGSVKVAMAMWSRPRRYLAQQLAGMAEKGCEVTIIGDPNTWGAEIRADLAGTKVKIRRVDGSEGDIMHSKIVIIDGHTADGRRVHSVTAGSPNWLHQSLYYNDELGFTTSDAAVVASYEAHLDGLLTKRSKAVRL